MKKNKFKYFIAASVSLITFLVYLSSLRNEFVDWDDRQYIFENPHIRSFDLTFFKWAFFDFYAANWHPLTWISHALDYAVWGLNPLGHHLTNNILHAVNTFIVVLLVVRLIEATTPAPPYQGGEPLAGSSPPILGGVAEGRGGTFLGERFTLIAAGVTGLLFGLHPLHVESVAWVAERKDLLCALFYLLSIMAYVKYAPSLPSPPSPKVGALSKGEENIVPRPWGALFLSLLFFTLALLSKPMAVSLPLVLLILDWYPFKRVYSLKTLWTVLVEKLPFIALCLVSSVMTFLAQKAGAAVVSVEVLPLSTRVLVATKSLAAYLWMMVCPLYLVPFYPYPENASLLSPAYFFAVALVIGITITCIVAVKKQRLWLSVWGCYVVTLMPVLGIVQVGNQAMADRYTYLPGLGPFLIMGLVVAGVSKKVSSGRGLGVKLLSAAVAVLMSASMTYLTFKQIGAWKDTFSLWTFVIENGREGVPFAYCNQAILLKEMGRFDEAIADCNRAIALDPFYYRAYNIRGTIFKKMGRFDEAIADYDMAIAMKPDFFDAYPNRGSAFEKIGRLDRAIADYDKAIALKPRNAETYANKGIAYGKAGLYDNSIESLNKALEIDPKNVDAYVSRGISYVRIGQNNRAFDDFNKAIRFNQNHILAYFNRGDLHLRTGKKELAMLDFQKACDLGDKEGCNALQALRATDK